MGQIRNLSDSIRLDLDLPPESGSAMLEIKNAGYEISGSTILRGINLRVERGEVLAIVGPNGAGKTTLLRLLSSDLHPTSGEILLDGIGVQHYSTRKLALKRAVMAQNAQITFEFTAYEVAMMGRFPHGGSHEDEQIVLDALHRTESDHLRERLYPTLSGGEQARVTLSRVLAQQTPLLLLDEPTAALDLRHQQIVMRITRELAAAGAAVVLILHDLNLAATHADRIGMLHKGELYAEGKPKDVFTEASIEAVFNLPVYVMPHPNAPNGDCPLIIPLEPENDSTHETS